MLPPIPLTFNLFRKEAQTAEMPFTFDVSRFPSSILPLYPYLSIPLHLAPHALPLTPLRRRRRIMPAGRQHVLHSLRLLIDPLIPGEASICREGSHRLNELIDLRIE